jgi:hypothetical protein
MVTLGKGKVQPRTGHEGPEVEQKYSSTLSLTSPQYVDGCSTPRPRRFTAGKDPVLPIEQEAGWAPGPIWTGAENLAPTGIRSPDRQARSESLQIFSWHYSYCSGCRCRRSVQQLGRKWPNAGHYRGI